MTVSLKSLGIDRLSVEERLALVEEIWDSIAADSAGITLTDAQQNELDRRLALLEAKPVADISSERANALRGRLEMPNGRNQPRRASSVKETVTSTYLFKAARIFSENSSSEVTGSFFFCMGTILFAALSFEAYLNHMGRIIGIPWASPKVRKQWEAKLEELSKDIQFQIDKSRRPYQTLKELFRFRDDLAHGRTTIVSDQNHYIDLNDPNTWPVQESWEKLCTHEYVKKAIEDVERFTRALNDQSRSAKPWMVHLLPDDPLAFRSWQSGTFRD